MRPTNSCSSRRSRRMIYSRWTSMRPVVTEIDGGFFQSRCTCCDDIVHVDPYGFAFEDETTGTSTGNRNVNMGKTFRKTTTRLALQTLKTYRDIYGVRYELVYVEKAAMAMNSVMEYYLTFTAKQKDDDKTKTMQAIVKQRTRYPFVRYFRIIPST